MSLIGFEGWDEQSASGQAQNMLGGGQVLPGVTQSGLGVWDTTSGGITKVAGQLGGSAIQFQGNGTMYCFLNTNYTRLIVGVRFKTQATPASNSILWFGDGNSSTPLTGGNQVKQVGIGVNASNKLSVWGSNSTGTVLATGTQTIAGSSYYYLEVDATFNSSTGSVTARLGGVTECSATNVNTANSGNNRCNMLGITDAYGTVGIVSSFDDLYLVDPTTGSAPYTSFLGVCRVETLFPTTNGTVTWTPNASTNVSQVQETSFDGDTTFNFASATNQDTFNHGTLSSNPATIYGVAVDALMRKDDVSAINANTTLVSGGTTQQGTASNAVTSYSGYRDIYTNDPNTAAAWTLNGVNNSLIGYKRV